MIILYLLPKNLMSRIVGFLMDIEWPAPIHLFLLKSFANHFQINLSEAEYEISSYPSIGKFFARKLKLNLRPIAHSHYLHPSDSVITECAKIENGQLIQAKGLKYSLAEFLSFQNGWEVYQNGFFCTYYLCPTDYHRVHSSVTGVISQAFHITGNLWPVNAWSTSTIANLFSVNERVVVEIQTNFGKIAQVFVGATNVGKISLSFVDGFYSNSGSHSKVTHVPFDKNLQIQKGDELGCFHMGSTVVVLFSPEFIQNLRKAHLTHLVQGTEKGTEKNAEKEIEIVTVNGTAKNAAQVNEFKLDEVLLSLKGFPVKVRSI
jgi:phosphatidylserine decarboxylase